MTGIRRLYQEMSRDNRDLSFKLERNHAMGVLLSAKAQRDELEQPKKSQGKKKQPTRKKAKNKSPKQQQPPSPQMISAINAYLNNESRVSSSKESRKLKRKVKI